MEGRNARWMQLDPIELSAIRGAYPNTLVIGAFLCLHRSDYVDYRAYGIEYRG